MKHILLISTIAAIVLLACDDPKTIRDLQSHDATDAYIAVDTRLEDRTAETSAPDGSDAFSAADASDVLADVVSDSSVETSDAMDGSTADARDASGDDAATADSDALDGAIDGG
jgi:hypothetical protein